MAPEHKEYKVSYELTEIFRRTREELPESGRKIMDDVWDGLQMVVAEINRAAEDTQFLNQTTLKEMLLIWKHLENEERVMQYVRDNVKENVEIQ